MAITMADGQSAPLFWGTKGIRRPTHSYQLFPLASRTVSDSFACPCNSAKLRLISARRSSALAASVMVRTAVGCVLIPGTGENMKRASAVLSMSVSALALAASTAAAATGHFAEEPQWLIDGRELRVPHSVLYDLSLRFDDLGALGVPFAVRCEGRLLGRVGPVRLGLLERVATPGMSCRVISAVAGVCVSETAQLRIAKLPRITYLLSIYGQIRDDIYTLYYRVSCQSLLGKLEDECEGETSSREQTAPTGVGVESVFGSRSERLICSFGGPTQGAITGTALTTAPHGKLTVALAPRRF